MDKKIPKVFANKVEKRTGNNEEVYYSNHDNLKREKNTSTLQEEQTSMTGSKQIPSMNINQKINAIFNSSNYIYKADCEIKLKNETVNKRIVGKNMTHLITMDNELIPIVDIVDIKRK